MRLNHFTRSPAAVHVLNVIELEGNLGHLITDSNRAKSQSPRECSPDVNFEKKREEKLQGWDYNVRLLQPNPVFALFLWLPWTRMDSQFIYLLRS